MNGAEYYLFPVSTNLVLKVADISWFDQGAKLKFSHFSEPFNIGPEAYECIDIVKRLYN